MRPLTPRQREVLAYVSASIAERGYPPTLREIGDHFGFTWRGACDHVKAIERKGYLFRGFGVARGIQLTPKALAEAAPPVRLVSIRQPWRCPECEAMSFRAECFVCAEARKEVGSNKHAENISTLGDQSTREVRSAEAGVQ